MGVDCALSEARPSWQLARIADHNGTYSYDKRMARSHTRGAVHISEDITNASYVSTSMDEIEEVGGKVWREHHRSRRSRHSCNTNLTEERRPRYQNKHFKWMHLLRRPNCKSQPYFTENYEQRENSREHGREGKISSHFDQEKAVVSSSFDQEIQNRKLPEQKVAALGVIGNYSNNNNIPSRGVRSLPSEELLPGDAPHAAPVRCVRNKYCFCSCLTHSCPPFQHLLSERLTSLGIMEAPRVPPLNPAETIVL